MASTQTVRKTTTKTYTEEKINLESATNLELI